MVFRSTNNCFLATKNQIIRHKQDLSILISVITNNFVPGYLGLMVTRNVQFCCIFAATKGKLDYFLKKLFHSSTSHTYHHNSSWFLSKAQKYL